MSSLLFAERVAVEPEVTPSAGQDRWEGAWPRSREEFSRFVDVFQDRLVWFAFRKLGNRSEAEEVVQEVFLRAYRHQEERGNVARVSSYLYRMASNACNDVLRKRGRAALPLSLSMAENIADPRAQADENAAALDELQRIETLLAHLPRRQAEAMRLRILDELSFAEIAEVLHCSLGTAKSRFRHGLRKLRAILELEREK
ncbi:MAG: RNA polymerase sigma factor [Candidatus Hydrogenedentes bacterium]|nr:RNA polymerase sigma factor [Candidatus Hydrogenedentota bacterium]